MTFNDLAQAIKVIAEIKGLIITQNNDSELDCAYNDIIINVNNNGELKSYYINENNDMVVYLYMNNTFEKILELFENNIIWNIV